MITIDGTKNASMDQNRSYGELVGQILREAEETDWREDELYGQTVVMSSRSTTGRSCSRPRSRSTRRTSGISSARDDTAPPPQARRDQGPEGAAR